MTKTDHSTNKTITYSYTDPTWADLMTSYNGQTITYDEIGNPLQYNNGTAMTFSWVFGRSLYTVDIGDTSISYAYDQEGIRTSKTIGDTYTKYYIIDGVMYGEQTTGSNGTTEIFYFYDDNDRMYGFSYNGMMYYYQYNLQGDVTGIYDANGQLVVEYKYDAWGKIISITGSLANTIGQYNPIRYRGYYYDNETGFYYVSSRYYDPEIGRFINADGYVSTGQGILGNNMFTYCGNNPINRVDPTGHFWSSILDFVKTAITEIGNAFAASAPAYAGVGGVALADGPILVGDTIAAIGALAVTAGTIAKGINQTIKVKTAAKEKEDAKVVANTKPRRKQAYFPINPYQFTPQGLVMNEYPGTKNGRIIKWKDPISNAVIFEWNEDFKNGAHYHTMMIEWDGQHMGMHYYPGMPVPEPWNSLYFGGQ